MAAIEKPKKDEEQIKPYTHYEQIVSRRVQHYYLSSAIEEPEQYVDMVHKIQTAGADEIIYIHLNTPGGHLDTGVQIINAMQSTQAQVTVSIEANCHSLGTLIFLAADEFIVHDNCLMMIHNFSGGVFGKGNEQQSQLEAQIKWFNTLAKKLYVPFLSVEEFNSIVRGEDLWLQSDDIRKRLEKMVKINQKVFDKMSKTKVPKKKGTKSVKKNVD
jgi:ATP-dependent protease ClpP protease subunit